MDLQSVSMGVNGVFVISVDKTFKNRQAYSHLDSVLLPDDTRAVYPRSAA